MYPFRLVVSSGADSVRVRDDLRGGTSFGGVPEGDDMFFDPTDLTESNYRGSEL
jgi:hypothetical protein